ncbi:MAG: OmpA family protein [Methyloversatilis sp.]|jgi:outer membrane protein OmpA-like peptidoglycan-associated protein|uniref:OmpA family protein n=1 Tax=Methyloversatilis TaxID=378210 RepID=UPI00036CC619|nr:OmpA family protein [Methyloversatilis discipulorum]MBC7205750.1 OmpA family protein [Methyloversatilis sp.]MBV5285828.1 OmpA family protein [Methyloversatilis discipulorum]MDY0057016.1 OmpA family protein [Methyloversatilis sp.]PZU53385.1 MAG: OmpA family protein [Thauera sp.]
MKKTLILLTAGALVATGCANMTETQKRTTIGTGVGAAAGAALGSAVGGSGGATRSGALIGAAVGGIGTYIWSQKMEEQKRAMEQATAGTGVDVVQTADNQLKLEIPSDISFDVGRADIKPNFRPVLDRFAQTLNANPTTSVRIIGHTDSTGSDAVNDPLSVNRAASARNYLADRGVASSRIVIDGRGSHEPLADNGSEAGRAKNRRVEIFVGEPGK